MENELRRMSFQTKNKQVIENTDIYLNSVESFKSDEELLSVLTSNYLEIIKFEVDKETFYKFRSLVYRIESQYIDF